MAIQTLSDLKALINSTIYDNTTHEISGSDVQTALIDAIDTLDSAEGFINVHKANGQTTISTYGSKAAARAAVPSDFHYQGIVIAYKLSTGWVIEQNLDATAGTWSDDASWVTTGPVSVSQNTSTGADDAASIKIGSTSYNIKDAKIRTDVNEQIRPFVEKLIGFTISNGKWMEGANYNSLYYPISKNDDLLIVPTSNQAYITILDNVPTPVNTESVNFATGFTGFRAISVATNVVVPNDGKYLVALVNAGATIYTPANIVVNGVDILKSIQKINEENAQPIAWASEIKPFIKKSINLFDNTATDITYGSYIQGGNLNTDAGYNVSGYIPVSPSSQYSHKVYPSTFGNTANRVCCYDKDKNYISVALGVVTDGINVFTPLADTAFVRVNVAVGDMDSYMFVEGATYPSIYIPFGIYTEHLDANRFSPLWGKKLCCDGDSIMHGAAQGGVSNGGFALPIAEKFNMTLQNIAVPGGTIRSNTYWDTDQQNPRHWICDSLATLDEDGDYYIFEGGVNDVGSSAVMGSVSWGYSATLDTTTFCGAFEKCCKTLVETFKGKKCGFVFVHRIWQPTDTLASSFFENQKAILKKWGIPFIDLMELAPALNLIDDLKSTYTNNADGWHPNKLGYATYYVPKIIAWLETL